MCVCCPALRPSSRQPVKRYKKLLDGPPNDRKILKLCEYAARNPLRLPKIAKFLEQRSYKELRCEHINFINIITETYCKLLCICKEQMAYFAVSLLNVIVELLDNKRAETVHILGCQTLTTFIYSQVWFMREFSHFFSGFDEIAVVALDNYDSSQSTEDGGARQESRHNWVNEVVRCEARGLTGLGTDINSNILGRPRPEIRDTSLLTREEIETPEIWAQICIQKIVEMAKGSSTMRRILEPMLIYFDTRKHWIPDQGLSMLVLSDISYWVKGSGNELGLIAAVIRHLDHKNVVHDPKVKSDIIQISAGLIRQLRTQNVVPEIGVISDLCRHLRKSLQATVDVVGPEESGWNTSLQSSIQNCLLEIVKGIDDAHPLFDMMAITLEELPPVAIVSRATIGSLLILAHIISITVHSNSQMKAAAASLSLLRNSADECGGSLQPILVRGLCRLTDLAADDLDRLLSETFTPDDELLFGPKSVFDWVRTPEVAHSEESLSFDEECSRTSSVGGEVTSESPAVDHPHFFPKKNGLPSLPQVISVGQLLESALQVAGQVAGTCVSTSPLPYGTMASQCEALGIGTRKKFSYWLGSSDELESDLPLPALGGFSQLSLGKERRGLGLDLDEDGFPRAEPCLALHLPPASPFDNFWKAARF
ncbi:unnamed protein product [Spirodela intermedia]|uniref:Uncharacterized protein n=1 Tax=Spirodela intermedia TaxID=51605 RepID=A0A7I8I9T5_SPIIN|nr:unnamed protein product [Spirodela intermedia]CAA6654409.1 unnamed protein product [Spirodela intermedia]